MKQLSPENNRLVMQVKDIVIIVGVVGAFITFLGNFAELPKEVTRLKIAYAETVYWCFIILPFSRCQSRSLEVARLSCNCLPFAKPISSLARPLTQYITKGTKV